MFEYIIHCLKTTYKYFALPLNAPAGGQKTQCGAAKGANAQALSEELISDISQLTVHAQHEAKAVENGPEDSDCIIEEEEEVEEYSDSDEEREKEKVDLGKSSLSEDEDEEDVDVDTHNRQHLDSFTTEDEDIFPVDEISGEELLSDEEGPDLDTPGSVDDEEEEEDEVELAPENVLPPPLESTSKDESGETKNQKQKKKTYEFTRQAFTKGKVGKSLLNLRRHKEMWCDAFKGLKKLALNIVTSKF